MQASAPLIDIHCHLLPEIDDGAKSWDESLAMARLAVEDGIGTIVVTPHQLGSYRHNRGETIRQRTAQLQQLLDEHRLPLRVLPGADVRIEADMLTLLRSGEVLTLADQRRHVLLELPHELYMPLEPVLAELQSARMVGILSHPERNQGLLADPSPIPRLVDSGCLMQLTAGSLLGTFGPDVQRFSETLLAQGLIHFVSSDAHGVKTRRPRLAAAYRRVAELIDGQTAYDLCCRHPALVTEGDSVPAGRQATQRTSSVWNFKSQISDFKSQISNLKSPISNLKSPISNLKSPISNLRSRAFSRSRAA
jgi:protein-tyrosine phosphatase